jgi:hypothetical protein
MNEADIKKLPKEEQRVLREEGIDKWHEKFCVDVKVEKLTEPQWVRKADWKECANVGMSLSEDVGCFLMNTIDGLTLDRNGYNIGCVEVFNMGGSNYDFRRRTAGTMHVDKSQEMLKVLKQAFKQAKKETKGKGITGNDLFCTVARLSGYAWDTTGKLQYAWYEKYGIVSTTLNIKTNPIPIHAPGLAGKTVTLSPRDEVKIRQEYYCLNLGLKPSYVLKDIENNK